MPLVQAKDFADSWRVHKFCPQALHPADACELNPERRGWSRHKCGILKSDLFKPCHYQVEVEEYYKRCVLDACACNSGGDCECLCAVVAAYAQKCARSGVVIPWRSQDLCPIQCEACDDYSPCISLCPPANCDNYLNPVESQSCSKEYCVDGCEPKSCRPGQVHRSSTNVTCVPEETCDVKPCIFIDGVPYREGERVKSDDACQSCYCRHGEVECVGVPCTYSTFAPRPTPIERIQECEYTGWTEWINSIDPEDNEGNDIEDLKQLVDTHRIPCPLDHVRSIECRSAKTQEPAEVTGQDVTCDTQDGMKCRRNSLSGECIDYEMRVYCRCHDEEEPCPSDQTWQECAFDCENSCHSLLTDMTMSGVCDGEKCSPGCVEKVCKYPYVSRDSETCVLPDHCTCKLESGFILAPGQVVTNGCEKCQCLNNTLICSTLLKCMEEEPTEETIVEIPFQVVTVKPETKSPRKTSAFPARGLVLHLTTPLCSYWSKWINKGRPKKGRRHGDKEDTRPYILKQTEGFCKEGSISAIECRETKTNQDYTKTNEEKLVCNLNKGFLCQNRHQPDGLCEDYKIRYFCSCSEATTPVPLLIKGTTPTYVSPCTDFVTLIDGPNPLSDVNLKASSSISPTNGPDAARMKNRGKAWTASEKNQNQFIEVDLNYLKGIYGIVTKGNPHKSEWVTSYQILYSADGVSYSYYQQENDKNKVFSGNFDATNEVKHILRRPFEAQFIRLEPLTWEKNISLKIELIGCSEEEGRMEIPFVPTTIARPKECRNPIGLENGALLDSQLSASTSFSSSFTSENSRLGSDSIWASAVLDDNQFLQVDFLDEANLTGIITKGREDVAQWVTAYNVAHSKDGIIWNKIKDEDGSLKEFSANYDAYTPVTNDLPATIRTRFLRILPTNWKNWISMQIEILGCYRPQPCRDIMGLDDGIIAHYQVSSSSKLTDAQSAPHAKLTSQSSWTPESTDKRAFIQVDLLEPSKITGVISKGDPMLQQWVKTYFVGYSNDSTNWKKVQDVSGKAKEFLANSDQDSAVINLFPISVTTRYIRVIPLKWHRLASMRLELLGCLQETACRDPMGLENGVLSDGQITASSSLDWNTTPSHARIGDKTGWIADPYDRNPYLQVDFIEPRNVSAAVTRGTEPNDYWVTKYKVLHSDDGDKWFPLTDEFGNVIEFPGNVDKDSTVVNTFPDTVESRYFRIIPLNYKSKAGLRLELLGCYHPYVCQEPLGMESGSIYDFQITASSALSQSLSPSNVRLDSETAWAPSLSDHDPHIQMDLLVPTNITGIMTRGRNDANEWVKTYEVSYSNDGFHWAYIQDDKGDNMELKGNFDNESPATGLFPTPIFSRFLRIKPKRYEKKTALRLEVLGCPREKECLEPMGLDSGLLSNSKITASSFKTEETSPFKVRLNSESSWSPSSVDSPQYIQVDFGNPRNISAIVTRGDAKEKSWVSAFKVTHGNDEIHWMPIKDNKGETIEFPANKNNDSPVISVLPETIEARFVRIIPTDWVNWINLRAEILGCYHPYEPPPRPRLQQLEEVLPLPIYPTEPTYVAACPNPMEPESSLLKDARIEGSSSTPQGTIFRIPLNTPGSAGQSGGWVPRVDDLHPYLMVELPDMKWLTSIYIQGREDEENWVKTIRVIASKDNKTWLPVFGPNGDEIIEGNEDQNSVVSHHFKRPMEARYIKLIPENWHRWPSFRLDLRGCHLPDVTSTVIPPTKEMQLCPELVSHPDLAINCPADCPRGQLCDGQECVDPLDCPCVHDEKIYKVSDKMEDSSCGQCDCALGGHSMCTEKLCPSCPQYERSILTEDCTCVCKGCEDDEVMCPSSHECIPKQRWCDGIVDCPDDENHCAYASTEETTTSAGDKKFKSAAIIPPTHPIPAAIIPPTHPIPENAACDVMGKHIKTFDGQDIIYDICHHTVMKDINGTFKVTLHKDCDYIGDCKHWLELKHKNQNIKVSSDLEVKINGHIYTPSQLWKLSKKSKFRNLVVERVGDQVTIKSFTKGFTLIYDNKGHLKIEVTPALMNRVEGLCGFYNGVEEDDQRKSNGKRAYTSREFGDSWTIDKDEKDCAPLICPHDVMTRALEQCNKLRDEPFGDCNKLLPIENFIEFCMSSTCECMLHGNSSDEKCKCDAFLPFVEACEDKLGRMAIRNWRFKHECHADCPPGMEWNDCGPSCPLTCDSSSDSSLEQCSEKCVPGCFCPPGTVLNEDHCIHPDKCADQMCQGFGDPHFMTFDGLFYPFQAEGHFLIVGDKENDFELNGYSRRCNIFTTITCLTGLEIIYKEHRVVLKKRREVNVNNVSISMDKLPLHSNGMVILGYPGNTFVVSIPQMNLEARYYEDNSGFAVKVPSKRYFNKTEGLCGNCNGKKDDELKGKPLSEFVCSWQIKGERDKCEKSMEDLPKLTDRVPMCKGLEDPIFEACHPLVDVEVYIDACSFDAAHSGETKAAFCKTTMEYARQCCQAGIAVENWPGTFNCEVTCPSGLAYRQCYEGCPQTCTIAQNESTDSSCNDIKIDGCFCPEGKVLKGEECVNSISCETCDEQGHVPGDTWNEGDCKKCHCRTDLTTECIVEVCPSKPVCSTDETLATVDREFEESPCCESYSCVPKIKNCPPMHIPVCKKGEVAKVHTRKDLCTEFECECDPVLCAPIVWPTDLDVGQVAEMVNDSCCRRIQVSCHEDSCPEKPVCSKGLELREREGECCNKYKCKPPEDVCVYTKTYKIEHGIQIKLTSKESTPSSHQPGDEWNDGLCEKCKCIESNGQHSPLCVQEQCPRVADMIDYKDYVLHELKIPEKCCPDIFRIQCKDGNGDIYEAGEQWSDENDPCINYVCEPNDIGEVQKTRSVINCTECPRTAVYFPPSKILGQCCGICMVTKCEEDDNLYSIGDIWEPINQQCRKAECVKEHGSVKTIYTKQPCPTIPKDCPENKLVWDEKGCCEVCNVTSEISCSTGPLPEADTIGFFTFKDDSHGGMCVNEKPVPNIVRCSGACHSQSYYSLEDGDFKDSCKCCKVNITVNRTIELICPDRSYIKKTFLQPETCQCSKCAPKPAPDIERYRTKGNASPWQQSVIPNDFNFGSFKDSQTQEVGQVPIEVSQEQEPEIPTFPQSNRFEPYQEVQQQQNDYDDMPFQTFQQEQHDYD